MCDWNEDGQRDIVVGCRNGYTMIYVEEGRGLVLLDTLRISGGSYLKVNYNSNPEVVDWNEDGKKDIVIGEQTGYVRLYINQGTNSNPVFSSYTNILSGGSPIYWYRANPRVVDLDLDGKKDLIVGENNANAFFYKNVGTNSSPVFSGYDTLRTTSGIIDEYYGLRPCINDWDEDGKLDLLTSDYYGYVRYYKNATIPGVEETKADLVSNLSVYPTVTEDRVYINYTVERTTETNFEVYNSIGERVFGSVETETAGNKHRIWEFDEIPAGVYIIKVNTLTQKVVLF